MDGSNRSRPPYLPPPIVSADTPLKRFNRYFAVVVALVWGALGYKVYMHYHRAPVPVLASPVVSAPVSSRAISAPQPSLDIGYVTPPRSSRISGCLVSSRGCRCVDRDGHTLADVPHDRCLAIANGQ